MPNSLIVNVKPGHLIPEAFYKKAVEQFPTALGYASPQDKDHVDWQFFSGLDVDLEDALVKYQKLYQEDSVTFWLVNDDDLTEEGLQPISLIETGEGDKALTQVAVILAGTFPTIEKGEHSVEYHFVSEYLYEKLDALYEKCGKDLKKLIAAVQEPDFQKDIKQHLEPKGLVMMITSEGAVAVQEPKFGTAFEWGWVSDTLGYEEPKKVVEEPKKETEPQKPLSLKEKKALVDKLKTEQNKPEPEKKAEPEKKPGELPKHDIALRNGIWYVMPPKNADWAGKKAWWNRHATIEHPKDDKTMLIGIPAFPADKAKLRSDSPIAEFVKKKIAELNKPKTADAIMTGDTAPTNEPTKEGTFVPQVSAGQKKVHLDMVEQGVPEVDFSQIEAAQGKIKRFSEQMNTPVNDILRYTTATYAKYDAHSLSLLCNELRMMLFEAKPELFKKASAEKKTLTLKEKKALASKAA